MSFYDWNRDGKKDFRDDFIEYQVYKDCTKGGDKDPDENYDYSGGSSMDSDSAASLGIILIIIAVIIFFTILFG